MPDDIFMRQLIAKGIIAAPPTPAGRRLAATAALTTAIGCAQAGDYTAAAVYIEDALAQVRVLRGMTEGGEG